MLVNQGGSREKDGEEDGETARGKEGTEKGENLAPRKAPGSPFRCNNLDTENHGVLRDATESTSSDTLRFLEACPSFIRRSRALPCAVLDAARKG